MMFGFLAVVIMTKLLSYIEPFLTIMKDMLICKTSFVYLSMHIREQFLEQDNVIILNIPLPRLSAISFNKLKWSEFSP